MRVAEHHEERRAQMAAGVLQTARHFRRHDIPGDADDEQFTESRIENQFRRHSRIAATQDGRIRMLALREIGDDFPLDCRKSRVAGDESFPALRRSRASSADSVNSAFELTPSARRLSPRRWRLQHRSRNSC
jgi:hypothetical protein